MSVERRVLVVNIIYFIDATVALLAEPERA